MSVLIVAALSKGVPGWFGYIYICLGLTHYAVSFIYSKKQMVQISSPGNRASFLLMICASALSVYYSFPPITYYFVVHCIFTEAYMMHRSDDSESGGARRHLLASRLATNAFIYIFILRNYRWFNFFHPRLIACGIFIAGIFLFTP